MRRQPRETKRYHFHNENPKGYRVGDCRFRAYALANNISWNDAVMTVAKWMVKTGKVDADRDTVDSVLQEFGKWVRHPMPKHPDGTRYKAKELARKLQDEPNPVIVTVASHTTCIKDGKIWDTWNCGEKCVCNYWTLEGA